MFQYENLEFNILNRKNNNEQEINSFLLDKLVIKDSNLEGKKSYKEGEISFERAPKKSIFNYWWKSLFSGIKNIVVAGKN